MSLFRKIFSSFKRILLKLRKIFSKKSQDKKGATRPPIPALGATPERDNLAVLGREQTGAGRGGASLMLVPRNTEKATFLAGRHNTHVFLVDDRANKPEIRAAVARQYGVRVDAVRMVRTPAKARRRGKQMGWKAGLKKAHVTLAEGERIESR